MTPNFYIITAKTNIHPGSGDTDYGIIDKRVQRDALDKLPCIYSQSIKGSLREYFDGVVLPEKHGYMDTIFGKTNKNGGKTAITEKDKGNRSRVQTRH